MIAKAPDVRSFEKAYDHLRGAQLELEEARLIEDGFDDITKQKISEIQTALFDIIYDAEETISENKNIFRTRDGQYCADCSEWLEGCPTSKTTRMQGGSICPDYKRFENILKCPKCKSGSSWIRRLKGGWGCHSCGHYWKD